ncbi:MAG: hypothetical protein ACXVB1_06585 [Pseudobdellovibrionaceae bacterium]
MAKYSQLLQDMFLNLIQILCLMVGGLCLGACGVSKEAEGIKIPPHFGKPEKPGESKDTLTLKAEGLKLTPHMQMLKLNSLTQPEGAEKYLKVQKKFSLPIQFNGWMVLDHVEHNYSKCAQAISKEPVFTLEDDHHGAVLIQPGERISLGLEKLYVVRLEFSNLSACQGIDIQFGVIYGTNE